MRGSTTIKFSEDVFVLKDIKNRTIKVPRKLQASDPSKIEVNIPVDEYPFIEVRVEAGEYSDASKLGFSYSVDFVDAQTIEINISWENPTYVSAE